MKSTWIRIGPSERIYAQVVSNVAGLVYVSVTSGSVRTSDYLTLAEAQRFATALLAATLPEDPPPAPTTPVTEE